MKFPLRASVVAVAFTIVAPLASAETIKIY